MEKEFDDEVILMREYKAEDNINHDENISLKVNVIDGVEPDHTHDFIEIVYISSGKGFHCVNGVKYDVIKGDAVFINFGQTHSFSSDGSMEYINCLLMPEFISGELINSENALDILALASFEEFGGHVDKATPKVSFRGADMMEVEGILKCMIREFEEKKIGYKSALKGYMEVFLTKIFRKMRSGENAAMMRHVYKISPEIIRYVEENFNERISLDGLAKKCFYNPSYFSRIFKQCYGKSLTDYIHEKRIEEAMSLLRNTKLSVEEICHRVGYSEKKQFYKIFKLSTGETPGDFRLSHPAEKNE